MCAAGAGDLVGLQDDGRAVKPAFDEVLFWDDEVKGSNVCEPHVSFFFDLREQDPAFTC